MVLTFPWYCWWKKSPADMVNIPIFIEFYTSQVVQDFFHQQYLHLLFVPSWSNFGGLIRMQRKWARIGSFPKFTLPETKSSPLKMGHPKRKRSYSNHPFSGANSLLRSGSVPIKIIGSLMAVFVLVVATQIFFGIFTPKNWGKMNPFWRAYFSDGLVQPPTSCRWSTSVES